MNNLRRLDVNQLVTLHALLREKHVSRAAQVLFKSQPTISHTLNQLRALFQDPLLIRKDGKYVLSSKAEALYPTLTAALAQLDALVGQGDFLPEQCHRCFNIALSDYGAAILLPEVIQILRQQAPNVDLRVWHCTREEMHAKLLEGSLDLAFGVFNQIPATLKAQTLLTDDFICVTDESNMHGAAMDLDQWLAHPHILVSMKPYEANEIDHCLELQNKQRRVAFTVPYWQLSTRLLSGNDLILTLAAKAVDTLLANNIVTFNPPISLPSLRFQMLWHPRSDSDNAIQWLKQGVIATANHG